MKTRLASLALFLVAVAPAAGQSKQEAPPGDDLFRKVAALDAEVFAAANRCDLEKLGSFFADDLEFYHDNGGLVHRSRQEFLDAVKLNLCGKVRRELVEGTLEVHPMRGYGALEIGVHRFHHPGRDDKDPVGEAKFIHLWQNKDGAWKITRVISYDHHPLAK
jgi:ketosteroid isomerase-like protein